ncbi:MAG: HK97 family phage prohead protease [Pseudomonadota bacterium]|jgi:HK97 family phage prohead protease
MKIDRLNCGLEVKFAQDDVAGAFSGYGAVFGNEDAGGDVIVRGAFRKTLAEWKAKKKLPKMLLQHGGSFSDGLLPIGFWTKMEEDDYGLKVEGQLYGLDTDRGTLVHEGLKSGALDGLSIGYQAVDFKYGTKLGEPRRTIKEAKLYEVSVVLFGMNGLALVTDAKAADRITTIREFEAFLRDEGGFSNAAAKAIAASGFKAEPDPRDEDGEDARALTERFRRLRGV